MAFCPQPATIWPLVLPLLTDALHVDLCWMLRISLNILCYLMPCLLRCQDSSEAPCALGGPPACWDTRHSCLTDSSPMQTGSLGDWLSGVSWAPGACKHELGDEGIHECRGTDITKNSSGGDMAMLPPLVRSLSRTVFYHQFWGRVLAGILGTNPLAPTCNKIFFLCVIRLSCKSTEACRLTLKVADATEF